jgi:hypothetical protein
MKYHGAGPCQNQILPSNSMIMARVYQIPGGGRENLQEEA